MFSFGNLRSRIKAASPTVPAETVGSDGEKLLDENYTQLIMTSTTAIEMAEAFRVPQSGTALDGELDSDWVHLSAEDDASLPGSIAIGESKQVVQEVLNALVEEAASLAEQLRQQEEQRQTARLLLEQDQQLEEKARAAVETALLLAKQELRAEAAEQKQAAPLVSLSVVSPGRGDDCLSHIKPPMPYSTVHCIQSLRASRLPDPELVTSEDRLYPSAYAPVKSGVLAARHKMSGSNGVFSVGQSQNPVLGGFFQCFLGVPLIATGLLQSEEDMVQNTSNFGSDEDVSEIARLTYGYW
jgi:hypothetical protein